MSMHLSMYQILDRGGGGIGIYLKHHLIYKMILIFAAMTSLP